MGKYGSCCTEIDIWEANKISSAYTMHVRGATDCGDNGADRFKRAQGVTGDAPVGVAGDAPVGVAGDAPVGVAGDAPVIK